MRGGSAIGWARSRADGTWPRRSPGPRVVRRLLRSKAADQATDQGDVTRVADACDLRPTGEDAQDSEGDSMLFSQERRKDRVNDRVHALRWWVGSEAGPHRTGLSRRREEGGAPGSPSRHPA